MRTHYCGELSTEHNSQTITVCGWVHRRRDHGGVIFIDLRDARGLLQVVVHPDDAEAFAQADSVRSEYVLQIEGNVRPRPEGSENEELTSGAIELEAKHITLLNASKTPPFHHDELPGEDVRLKYRYIDLRRASMQHNIRLRHKVSSAIRAYLDNEHFVDIETPILTRATPEGARDYLVPSRTHAGQFFALPQSPQLFKQLLMVSGFDRYYQIPRCFRDEDLRADRQPEFTQLDIEMSFVEENDVMALGEDLMRSVFKSVLSVDLPKPFPSMTYAEAMQRFGSDKPDLRIDAELIDVADVLKNVDFKVFAGPANDAKGRVAVLNVSGGASLSRKDIDGYTEFVGRYGAKGLAYIKVNDVTKGAEGLQSPIVKFLPEDAIAIILERTGAKDGDLLFFGADKAKVVNDALGALRVKVAEDLGQVKDEWAPLWVTDFPMFEYDADAKRYMSVHHPFTAPSVSPETLKDDPAGALSRAYDMVINGYEIGGGSIRIHNPDMQKTVFKALGIDDQEADTKFGFFLEALEYGVPPHGGIAFGLDRWAMLMAGAPNIREVIAFPKTQTAACLLTDAPGETSEAQLDELNIRVKPQAKSAA